MLKALILLKEIEKMLKLHGAYDIEHYTLINNDGFYFMLNNKKYDLRHYRNIYGVVVDYISVSKYTDDENGDIIDAIRQEANDLNDKYKD